MSRSEEGSQGRSELFFSSRSSSERSGDPLLPPQRRLFDLAIVRRLKLIRTVVVLVCSFKGKWLAFAGRRNYPPIEPEEFLRMLKENYPWQRLWCPPDGRLKLTEEGCSWEQGQFNKDVVTLESQG